MRHVSALLISALLLMVLAGPHAARSDDKTTSTDLRKIQPPGGIPLPLEEPGKPGIKVDLLNKVKARLDAVPAETLDRWVAELERIMGQKLEGELAPQACRTDFVMRMTAAFDDLSWNAAAGDKLFKRAQTLPTSEARAWKDAFEALLKKKIGQTATTNHAGGPAYAVPLVLIPIDALYDGQKYNPEHAKKYRSRLTQLTAEDVSMWKDKIDQFGGTKLDAAVNIILLDVFFDKEQFQRQKFKSAIGW